MARENGVMSGPGRSSIQISCLLPISCLLHLLWAASLGADTPASPVLAYSTYLRESFKPTGIATDAAGNIYLAGNVNLDPASSLTNGLLLKLNPQASAYLYVRYFGGSRNDSVNALAVDAEGNAYIAGVTTSPDFPVTSGGNFGTAPANGTERSFVAKFDPAGQLTFADLLGASTNSYAQAISVSASGQVLVSGTSVASGFPASSGAYNIADTTFAPYLLELDPAGKKILFAATGIGGTSIAFDPSGNIVMAGTTNSLTYPLTPGTYQPSFPVFQTCVAPCIRQFQGANQYVTALDPTGSKILFSTSVSGGGNTMNNGLALDAEGNIYLTGLAGAAYPFTVTPPTAPTGPALSVLSTPALPFVTKLDPLGQKLLYSVPVGGVGVRVDANGLAYVGGILGPFNLYDVAANLPALSNIPPVCWQSEIPSARSAYVSQVDPTGRVSNSRFLGGTSLALAAAVLSNGKFWVAGTTNLPNFAFTPNALAANELKPVAAPGAYLGAVDFSPGSGLPNAPQIGCVVDPAGLQPAGPLAPNQLVTIYGSGLGPQVPVIASDYGTTTLGGVTVSFGTLPATLLYVSSNQINLAVPSSLSTFPSSTAMQVTFNDAPASPMQYAVAAQNPSIFLIPGSYGKNLSRYETVALNQDGSRNSVIAPAKSGSVVSIFLNGLRMNPGGTGVSPALYSGWTVVSVSQLNPFVVEVDMRVPVSGTLSCPATIAPACTNDFTVYDLNSYLTAGTFGSTGGLSISGIVYVAP